jgi:type IV pilus assembly protein PilO
MSFAFLKSQEGDLSEPPALSEQLLRRLWLGLPIAAFGLVATLLAAGVLLPLLISLRSELGRAERLQRLQGQLTEVNNSLARRQAALKQAETQTSKLRTLLVGGGDRGTVLATLDNDAKATGVSLALYEQNALGVAPGAAPAKPGTPAPGAKPTLPGSPAAAAPGAPPAPAPGAAAGPGFAADGVVENPLLLSVQGSFPQILAFLQRLERLQVLVKQQELSLVNLAMAEKPAGGAPSPEAIALQGSSPILVMKLSLVVFDAPGGAASVPAGAATTPGRPAPGSPPGPPGPPAPGPPAPGPPAPGPPAPGPPAPAAAPAAGSAR